LTAYQGFSRPQRDDGFWSNAVRSIQTQWGLARNLKNATEAYISSGGVTVSTETLDKP